MFQKENTNHKYIGKGLKVNNKITYYDEKIKTQIILSDKIVIIRESEYYIELNLKEKNKLQGKYQTKYGNLNLETSNVKINQTENSLYIKYDLIIDNEFIDTFEYILNFSLDTI